MSSPYPLTPRPPGAWGTRSSHPRDPLAVTGLVLGIVALVVNPLFATSIVGIVLSSRARGRATDERNRELSTAGIVVNVTAIGLALVAFVLAMVSLATTIGLCLAGSAACGLN